MRRFLRKTISKNIDPKIFSILSGKRVYCIGDIHGRDDLLINIHEKILLDSANYFGSKVVIYLGDYIDRGLHSKEVVDILLSNPLPGFSSIHLRGNHEQIFLDFLNNAPVIAAEWLNYGGQATILSYGISMQGISFGKKLKKLQQELLDKIPTEHLSFYNQLKYSYQIGGYFFVHAGVKPKVSLDKQSKLDMITIRNEFLDSNFCYEKMIIHGHSICDEPIVLPNRIGIDTGAYYSGKLTCLVLEGEYQRFISTI
ncbi:MAG: serine/threonine protein phosphatase [Methylococcales bacterium]|nr:serine/threonine protein phosphatase [Methylococcales bacterium]